MLENIGLALSILILLNIIAVVSWIVFCEWRNWKTKRRNIAFFEKVEDFRRDFDRVVEKS